MRKNFGPFVPDFTAVVQYAGYKPAGSFTDRETGKEITYEEGFHLELSPDGFSKKLKLKVPMAESAQYQVLHVGDFVQVSRALIDVNGAGGIVVKLAGVQITVLQATGSLVSDGQNQAPPSARRTA